MRRSVATPHLRNGLPVLPAGFLVLTALASSAAGLIVAVLLLSPPQEEAIALATYFAFSGLATLAGASALLWLFEKVLHPSLAVRTKVIAGLGVVPTRVVDRRGFSQLV